MTKKKNEIVVDPVEVELRTKMDNLVEDIKEIDVKIAETDALFESKVSQLKEHRDDRVTILNTTKAHKEMELRALFEQVPQSETKTQRKVSLLTGDVVIKKPTQKIEYDSKKMLEYLQDTIQKLIAEEIEITNKVNGLYVEIGKLNEMPPNENTDKQLWATINEKDVLEEDLQIIKEQLLMHSKYIEKKNVESLKWAELKEVLQITDIGIINTETGDVLEIDGLSVREEAEKLVIK